MATEHIPDEDEVGIPTDRQILDQLEVALGKLDDGFVCQDMALRKELALALSRFNRPLANEYYLQDKRSHVGNCVLWWRKNGEGYTTDLREAHVYTKEEAYRQHECRETDIPWPKAYIDARSSPTVDMQKLRRAEATANV